MKNGFPIHILQNQQSALCLFAAAFCGINDVIHLHRAGLTNVTVVDNDTNALNKLTAKFNYPSLCTDAFALMEQYRSEKQKFDIVISDHFTNCDEEIYLQRYATLQSIASQYLITGINQMFIDKYNFTPDGELYKRSDFRGGTYWILHKINP